MWVIGMLVCMGLMLGGGHAVRHARHGSTSHHGEAAAAAPVAPTAAPHEAPPAAAPENSSEPQQEPTHHR